MKQDINSTLQSLFKNVGVCVTDEGKITQVFIVKSQVDKVNYHCYIGFDLEENEIFPEGQWLIDRFALEEEKEEILNIIKNQAGWLINLEAIATKLGEMIECKMEENKPNIIEEAKTYWDSIKDAWICPEGYQFVDENGNVINATQIVLEKKKE